MRLGVYIPNITDGTSFYRGHGWTSEIHKTDDSIRVEYFNKPEVLKLKGLDAVFIQRPDNEEELKFIRSCKKLQIPVIVDYDDNLFEVQDYNRYYIIMDLAQNDYQKYVKEALVLSDLVLVTTEVLKKELSKYSNNIEVVRNAWDDYYQEPAKTMNKSDVILWRGSSTHKVDMELYKNEIIEITKKYSNYRFVYLTDRIYQWQKDLAKEVKNMFYEPAVSVFEYYSKLKQLNPALVWVTLENTVFNRCKSDVGLQEALGCGALCIAPDWEEWQDAHYKFNTNADFVARFDEAIKHIETRTDLNIKQKPRLLSNINVLRAKLIKKIALKNTIL